MTDLFVPRDRTWAEIDLDNLEYNYRSIRAHLRPGTRFLGVVKADAYGHGAVPVAKTLEEIGCEYLAVATVWEAIDLREHGIALPILILGYTAPEHTALMLQYDITASVSEYTAAVAMSEIAQAKGAPLKVHLKADSGMGRLGFVCHDGADPSEDMAKIMALPGLSVEGIFTHFAVSDVPGDPFTAAQYRDFTALIERLEAMTGQKFKIKHCVNSGAVINYIELQMDMIRPGIALYGLYPAADRGQIDLRPVMEMKTRVVQIKTVDMGQSVSYGRNFIADTRRTVAVLPIGYADGLHRVLSGRIDVLVRGRRARQIGNICMDMCMVDITGISDVAVGDVVTIFGKDGDAFISVDELAEKAGTISYELLCSVSKRIPRVYIRGGVTI